MPENVKTVQQQKKEARLLAQEEARTAIEKYRVKEIGGWRVGLFWLGYLLLFIYLIIAYAMHNVDATSSVIILAGVFFFAFANDIEDEWKKRLEIKHKLNNPSAPSYKYEYGYIYTDSAIKCYFYKLYKFIVSLSAIAVGGALTFLVFSWLGSLSIAPTTIIIILLIIIIIKMD